MASNTKTDKFGGQVREEAGEEQVSMWLPITAAEKEAVVQKAMQENVAVPQMLAQCLRGWLKGGELSLDQLDQVVGGVLPQRTLVQENMAKVRNELATKGYADLEPMDPSSFSTVMCPW